MVNTMKLEIKALGVNEGFARSAVAAFALCLNPSLTELSDIKTAVSEAVTNSVVHAYTNVDEVGKICIECQAKKGAEGIPRPGQQQGQANPRCRNLPNGNPEKPDQRMTRNLAHFFLLNLSSYVKRNADSFCTFFPYTLQIHNLQHPA